MKTIPLKKTLVRLAGQAAGTPDMEFAYADAIYGILNAGAAERGVPLAEISKALRIISPVQKADADGVDSVALEDADWEFLKRAVDGYRGWRIIHPVVEEFTRDILNPD